jgi:hypothetical protein
VDCTTVRHARNELHDRLIELGHHLDHATDPDVMRALIIARKTNHAALAALRQLTSPRSPTARRRW